MSDWVLSYDKADPETEGLRETLCALGNGYIVSRAASPYAMADDVHYPGTYLAGGYNRLVSEVAGHEIENEDLVNLPNWLPVTFAAGESDWLRSEDLEALDYRQELNLRSGMLQRRLRLRDPEGRVTRWDERRLVSMHDPHIAALSITLTPENWSGRMRIRSGLDGSIINWGVKRYRSLEGRHLETLETLEEAGILGLRSRFVQARREVALAARTNVTLDGAHASPLGTEIKADLCASIFEVEAREGRPVSIEKIAAYFNSKDHGISEPLSEALDHVRHARDFRDLAARHETAWNHLWEQFEIDLGSHENSTAQLKLRLHIFHLLQTASAHSVDTDVGMPPRGWHGEAYRGHIMWDELFIFPYLTLRMPVLTRALLRYRWRRLDEVRRAAREAGFRGAMFPWQSGSSGREESQRIHLNPKSGRWIPDNSHRQRHIGSAIAYNVWEYVQATDDRAFLRDYGAELFCEIARFWASMAEERPDGRYGIRGVMGPDEFHTAYPGADPSTDGGLDNNAYTNFMAAWVLSHVDDVLELIPRDERRRLCERLDLTEEELKHWQDVSCRLFMPFHDDGIISQFEGYDTLKEFDWDRFRTNYENLQRLDRILEAEGDDPNNYKVSKQADVLMIFYLFSREEIQRVFEHMGYPFGGDRIFDTIEYYMDRTSHGSTLSWVAHAWVLARADRQTSWELALKALDADISDIQGGTTPEGIHLGAMAGTVDLLQRCYTGLELRSEALLLNPRLPEEVERLRATVRYRGQVLDLDITQDCLKVSSRIMTAYPVTVSYRGQSRQISPGQSFSFGLIPEIKPDRSARERAQDRVGRHTDTDRA